MCRTICVIQVYEYRRNSYVATICVIHMLYTCYTHKTPHMYYRCGTTSHVHKNPVITTLWSLHNGVTETKLSHSGIHISLDCYFHMWYPFSSKHHQFISQNTPIVFKAWELTVCGNVSPQWRAHYSFIIYLM